MIYKNIIEGIVMNNKIIIRGNNNNYFEIIDFMKGFSILTIVFMHLIQDYLTNVPALIQKASSFGGTGVHIFFFCSGFGLFIMQRKKGYSFVEFIKSRFFKIYIPYIFVVLVSFFIPYMYNGDRIKALFSHIFLYKMFDSELIISFGGHFWFISTIFQFYLIFILMYKIYCKIKAKKFLLLNFLISAIWWIFQIVFNFTNNMAIGYFCFQFIWEFALAFCLADYLLKNKSIELNRRIIAVMSVIGICIATAIIFIDGGKYKVLNDVPGFFGYICLCVFIYSLNCPILKKIILSTSKISYELYLIHLLVFSTVFFFFNLFKINNLLVGMLSFFVSIVFAYIIKIISSKIYNLIYDKCK